MSNLHKMLSIAVALDKAAVLTPASPRLELKRGKGGMFRLYIATPPAKASAFMQEVDAIAEQHGCDANPFKNAGMVEAVTFVDYDERKAKPEGE